VRPVGIDKSTEHGNHWLYAGPTRETVGGLYDITIAVKKAASVSVPF
jgi:hypothetical protein